MREPLFGYRALCYSAHSLQTCTSLSRRKQQHTTLKNKCLGAVLRFQDVSDDVEGLLSLPLSIEEKSTHTPLWTGHASCLAQSRWRFLL